MKHRVLAFLMAGALVLSTAACGGQEPSAEDQVSKPIEDAQGEEDLPAVSPEEPEEPEEPESPPPAAKPDTPAQKPEAPEQVPPESGSGVDLDGFASQTTSGDTWTAMGPLEGESLEALYPGLSAIASRQQEVLVAMISASAQELALVEVESADDAQAVKDIFQARVDYQVGTDGQPGGACYPASIELWQNSSRIVSNGNFVMLVVHEDADAVVDSFNGLFA